MVVGMKTRMIRIRDIERKHRQTSKRALDSNWTTTGMLGKRSEEKLAEGKDGRRREKNVMKESWCGNDDLSFEGIGERANRFANSFSRF